MAKYTPGPAVAAVSGSVGGTTFSRNRGGQYMRRRAIPTRSTTVYAQLAKAILAARSQAWQSLTAAQRAAWLGYAQQFPVLNTLGNSFTRSGQQAYVAINSRLALASAALLTAPPIIAPPPPLLTYTQTYDIGAGSVAAAYTTTPIAAGVKLWIQACVLDSAGRAYVENLYRFVGLSAAAQASPFDMQSLIEARLGTLVVGQTLHVKISTFDTATGLISVPRSASGAIITT